MSYKYKIYIEENDEVRCGFRVSANRKKVRNIQLGLIEAVKDVCKKHNLKYYADSGTLLGAIRHKGFIPWDDDSDIVMLRDDYDKFMKIASKELPKHLVLQTDFCGGFAKLRNEKTLALDDFDKDDNYLGGISLDIFPLDFVSKLKIVNIVQKYTLIFIRGILISLKYKEYFQKVSLFKRIFGYFCRFLFKYFNYESIYKLYDYLCKNIIFIDKLHVVDRCESFQLCYNVKDFERVKDVAFENIEISIPLGYENILRRLYGDYSKPVIWEGGHNNLYSIDKGYKEMVQNGKIDKGLLFSL